MPTCLVQCKRTLIATSSSRERVKVPHVRAFWVDSFEEYFVPRVVEYFRPVLVLKFLITAITTASFQLMKEVSFIPASSQRLVVQLCD